MTPPMDFLHGLFRNFLTVFTRGVGSETAARPTYTFGGAGNQYYVAMNGNDANSGLSPALAKRTVANAAGVAVATDGIILIRNGFVGEMRFVEGNFTIATNVELATEDNQDATVEMTSAAIATFSLNSRCYNTKFECLNRNIGQPVVVAASGVGVAPLFSNVTVVTNRSCIGNFLAPAAVTLQYCQLVLTGSAIATLVEGAFLGAMNSNTSFTNCAFVNAKTSQSGIAINTQASLAAAQSVNLIRCMFYGFRHLALMPGEAVVGNRHTLIFRACDINARFISLNENTVLAAGFKQMYFASCRLAVSTQVEILTTPNNGVFNFVERGALSPARRPMYADERGGGSYENPEGFRLQWRGKEAPGGNRFFITSPLVAGSIAVAADGTLTPAFPAVAAGLDVTPYDESTTDLGWSFSKATKFLRPATSYTIDAQLKNVFSVTDIKGDLKSDYDARKRLFTLSFADNIGNLTAFRALYLSLDRGALMFFPRGFGGTLFIDPATCEPDGTNGDFLNVDPLYDDQPTFEPSTISLAAMVPNHWQGYWILFAGAFYRIASNNAVKFALQDKFGFGFPIDGTYAFTVEFILVKPTQESVQLAQAFAVNFEHGGGFREPYPGGTNLPSTAHQPFEFKVPSLTFEELENPQEDFE